MKPDLVFKCNKCDHNLFITNGIALTAKEVAKKLNKDCPNCGEESFELWTFSRLGNFDKEYGDKN